MKVSELFDLIKRHLDIRASEGDRTVMVSIAKPSVGPRAAIEVKSACFGFDWESGRMTLHIWDMSKDLLYFLATEKGRTGKLKNGYENRRARLILERAGYDGKAWKKDEA